MKNNLKNQTSPYLEQHKNNPVFWNAWSEDVFKTAKRLKKPIFLSIGYASCHWCHVMAHESFEDKETAKIINENFISVKVDREERPDIDLIYQNALALMGEQGGWPLSIFLTPEKKPFWGGTYFPKTSMYGRPSFKSVLMAISNLWYNEIDKIEANITKLIPVLKKISTIKANNSSDKKKIYQESYDTILNFIDFINGGLKGAPKFPHFSIINSLIRKNDSKSSQAWEKTLDKISLGGIYDHIGGGLSRYSVDETWLVPHFEKMLYDNALFIESLAYGFRKKRKLLYENRVKETIQWIKRDMVGEIKCFCSSYDADTPGGSEGDFYVWSENEINNILKNDSLFFKKNYNVSAHGNWEKKNILNISDYSDDIFYSSRMIKLRLQLFDSREKRLKPKRDDKILTDWNSLLITSLCEASDVFKINSWLNLAEETFNNLLKNMLDGKNLYHSYNKGKRQHKGTLDDYGFLLYSSSVLYEKTLDVHYKEQFDIILSTLLSEFWDKNDGGFFFTSSTESNLLLRPKVINDGAIVNSNTLIAKALNKMSSFDNSNEYFLKAKTIANSFFEEVQKGPISHASLLSLYEDVKSNAFIYIIKGEKNLKLYNDFILFFETTKSFNLTKFKIDSIEKIKLFPSLQSMKKFETSVIVCKNFNCSLPLQSITDLESYLKKLKVII